MSFGYVINFEHRCVKRAEASAIHKAAPDRPRPQTAAAPSPQASLEHRQIQSRPLQGDKSVHDARDKLRIRHFSNRRGAGSAELRPLPGTRRSLESGISWNICGCGKDVVLEFSRSFLQPSVSLSTRGGIIQRLLRLEWDLDRYVRTAFRNLVCTFEKAESSIDCVQLRPSS